ncbi:MAG: tRNA epoxyqueuosine(34) reductase QueG [Porphyromonadaceae bacterium CG2_30_38_12]|nr:MAG: tRNA epoxyqueuosine(34) reductase QueG [Porphyromonadaceae bacterium CG2_30_38_12]
MTNFIKQKAKEIGFDACGIAKASYLEQDADFMKSWLAAGKHGEMAYLERNFEKRTNPSALVPGTKSVLVVLLNYFPSEKQPSDSLHIARYAHAEIDYHTVLKTMLSELENALIRAYGTDVVNSQFQHTFVDSAPVLERRWAQRAGLGWIGKHTQLIAPGIGSYCFIGSLMLGVELDYDEPIADRCGTCSRCLQACPTNALDGTSIDARLCISYQTIEKKGSVDASIQPNLLGFVLGCDICADVCPWNKKWAIPHRTEALRPALNLYELQKRDWQELSAEKYKAMFQKSAVKRAGFSKLKQNIAFALQK